MRLVQCVKCGFHVADPGGQADERGIHGALECPHCESNRLVPVTEKCRYGRTVGNDKLDCCWNNAVHMLDTHHLKSVAEHETPLCEEHYDEIAHELAVGPNNHISL